MKKVTILTAAFLVVFGITLGMVLSLNEDAHALQMCAWSCLYSVNWSHDTGPRCPCIANGSEIYYVYRESSCIGGPLNCPYRKLLMGCWDGVDQVIDLCH